MNKKFDDILSKAVNSAIYPTPLDLLNTDHGYLAHEKAIELVNYRLTERLKHESYVTLLENCEM